MPVFSAFSHGLLVLLFLWLSPPDNVSTPPQAPHDMRQTLAGTCFHCLPALRRTSRLVSAFFSADQTSLSQRPYLPRLVPVEVRESKARHWFAALADGVLFLHARGVVHNDIK